MLTFITIVMVQHYCVANVCYILCMITLLVLVHDLPFPPLPHIRRSLGCTVVEMLTGKPPLSKLEPVAAMFRTVTKPETIRSQLPFCCSKNADVDDFLSKCFVV